VRGRNIRTIVQELNQYLRGWNNYYGLIHTQRRFEDWTGWIRRRLRNLLWAQWRNNWRRAEELLKAGLDPTFVFYTVRQRWKGPWAMSNSSAMKQAFGPGYFRQLGLHELTIRSP